MKKLLLLFTFLLSLQVQATHLMGGQMTSKNIGSLTYEVTLTLYRDTQGIPMSTTETINYQDSLGTSIIASHTIPINNMVNIGNGVERYQFIDTMTFSTNGNYKAYYTNCCRNASIINIPNASSYSMYLDVDIFADPTNSSPVFLNEPITLAQDSVLFTYNPLPFDADGDSLSWVLDTPMDFLSGTVTGVVIPGYVLPYSYPSTPFQLDPLTGEITFLPNTLGNFQVSVKAIEWRNGVQIGYIRRDMQLIVIPSPNIPIQVSTTTSVLRATSTNMPINLNVGETLTFTLDAYNPDGGLISFEEGGSAFLTSTPASVVGIQNTTFNCTATITWTPTLAEVNNNPYYLSFRIGDPWGPYTFFNDYTYSVLVTNNLTNINDIKSNKNKYVIKSINMLGQEIDPNSDGFRIDVYSDGSTQKIYKLN